jgi:murein DD-endopeptidase MepM/ murein hydrolase activator NlpD
MAENDQEGKGVFRNSQFPLFIWNGARSHSSRQGMEAYKIVVFPMIILLAFVVLCASFYPFWRHARFFRNPQRIIPPEGTGVLSPADGTVVYASETSACYPCTL